jgi:hypothetical protein
MVYSSENLKTSQLEISESGLMSKVTVSYMTRFKEDCGNDSCEMNVCLKIYLEFQWIHINLLNNKKRCCEKIFSVLKTCLLNHVVKWNKIVTGVLSHKPIVSYQKNSLDPTLSTFLTSDFRGELQKLNSPGKGWAGSLQMYLWGWPWIDRERKGGNDPWRSQQATMSSAFMPEVVVTWPKYGIFLSQSHFCSDCHCISYL